MGRKSIIHRDLKPENILLNSKARGVFDLRIADFGYAINLSDLKSKAEDDFICGTPGYIAPEVLAGGKYTLKADLFSVGAILYALLTFKNYFKGRY